MKRNPIKTFKIDKEFSGSDGGPTGYDDYDFHMNHCLEGLIMVGWMKVKV